MKTSKNGKIVWRFFRAGGFDQVRLESARELLSLDKLDQKLWVALACPVDNVFFDRSTLSLIDTDNDGRIRPAELIAALGWVGGLLKDPETLLCGGDGITADAINETVDEGRALAETVRRTLKVLGRDTSDAITVADTLSLRRVLSEKVFNGDGVITEECIDTELHKALFRDIVAITGALPDRSGKPGVDETKINLFFPEAAAYIEWIQQGETPTVQILGDKTGVAAAAFEAVREKIGDYFTRCAVAQFDDRSTVLLNGSENEFAAMGSVMLSGENDSLARLPVAKIEANRPLPLRQGINPAWASRIKTFADSVAAPLAGVDTELDQSAWNRIVGAFVPWNKWQAARPSSAIGALGADTVRKYLSGDGKERLVALIRQDREEAAIYDSLLVIERLVRYRRDLASLCSNFVNFKDFYATGGRAIFQAGTLYIDQRSCTLCIKVDDANRHASMAAMAGTCLIYCDCRRNGGAEKCTIVAAVTNGDSDNLMVGRNGVFYGRDGRDWDATITRIIENPISLKQAFWSPYKGLVRMIEQQVAKRAAAAEAQTTVKMAGIAENTANADKAAPVKQLLPAKVDVGAVAALGVAAGALGTFVATAFGYAVGIMKLGPLAMVGACFGLLLLISGPSLILAYIKLRKRNLGPILDAGGWAVNAKARINVPFGEMLTKVAAIPTGSRRSMADPFREKGSPWPRLAALALLIYIVWAGLDHFGLLHRWTGGRVGRSRTSITAESAKTTDVSPAE